MKATELVAKLQERIDKHPEKDYDVAFFIQGSDTYEVKTVSSFSNYPSTGGPLILLGTN